MNTLKAALSELDEATQDLLSEHHFDRDTWLSLASDIQAASGDVPSNLISGELQPPSSQNLDTLPPEKSEDAARLIDLGMNAIANDEVMVLVLNGGMATRFGGVVKGVVPVLDNLTFIGWKLQSTAQASRGHHPRVLFLNSFSTHEATLQHLEHTEAAGYPRDRIETAIQNISLRLTPEGALFRNAKGDVSPYAPGHGDVLDTLKRSDAFHRFRKDGGKYVFMCNVDNILATLDPLILGAHIDRGLSMTVESAPRVKGDKGGAPIAVNGRVEIVEGFRIPQDFDIECLEVFNTNTFWMNVECWDIQDDLTWFTANKIVDDLPALQFERLIGEITHFVDASYLRVSREGKASRFFPVKTPDELEPARKTLIDRLNEAENHKKID